MTDKINSIKKACKITDNIFKEIVKKGSLFKTELDIKKFIKNQIKKNKVKSSFPSIIATGKNAAEPHHKPKKTKLDGFTVIDFGVKVGGYCSDMSRTLFFGKPTKNQIKIYNFLLKAQKSAIRDIKTNKKYFDIDKKCRTGFGRYKKYFIHCLGHGVGKKPGCYPLIISDFSKKKRTKKQKRLLEKVKNTRVRLGDVITIEPGIYVKNKFGIRIEDVIAVQKNKIEILTKSPKKLIII